MKVERPFEWMEINKLCFLCRRKQRVSTEASPVIETLISPDSAQVEKSEPPLPTTLKAQSKPEPPKPKERLRQPEFILKLRDKSAVEGSSVRLACRAMGTPEPGFQWYKDSEPISAGGRFDINQSVSGFTLVIKECQLEDSGEYQCEATNKVGSVSTSAKVTITGWSHSFSMFSYPEFI